MAAGKNKVSNDQANPDKIEIPQPDEDLDAETAATMVAEGIVGSSDEDDLEAQMTTAMEMESGDSDEDDLMRQMAAAIAEEKNDQGRAGLLDALSEPDEDSDVAIQPVKFPQLRPSDERVTRNEIERLLDVSLVVSVELGRKQMQIKDILELGPGKIIELEKLAGEPVDLLVNGKLLARGEVVVVDENFGVRITDLIDPKDRLKML